MTMHRFLFEWSNNFGAQRARKQTGLKEAGAAQGSTPRACTGAKTANEPRTHYSGSRAGSRRAIIPRRGRQVRCADQARAWGWSARIANVRLFDPQGGVLDRRAKLGRLVQRLAGIFA